MNLEVFISEQRKTYPDFKCFQISVTMKGGRPLWAAGKQKIVSCEGTIRRYL